MILGCVDVDYRRDGSALAACLVFDAWTDAVARAEHTVHVGEVEPYVPGAFYRRELPCVLAALERAGHAFDVVIVDAYVTLDAAGTPGLGAHLHAALGGNAAIVGVAKTRFQSRSFLPRSGISTPLDSSSFVARGERAQRFAEATSALPVTRGTSVKPLWVSAIGVDPNEAAERVHAMHGPHRVPTLLKRVDRLARDA